MSDRHTLPRTVWALGFVSLLMDVSSETVHALLPLFLTTTLGASVAFVGLIDGVAESTASIAKVFSGYLSDRMRRRQPLILIGYGLAALSKPLFAVAGSAQLVLGARFADRIGKGLRGAPRDALIADVTPESIRGRAFGLRQSLDTVGAFVGPLLAIVLMLALADDIRAVFWLAAIPAVAAVLVVLVWVRDPPVPAGATARPPLRMAEMARLGRPFWALTGIGVVFTLARFSEAFLILRAHELSLPVALAPAVLVAMNIVYALGAYPVGILADRLPSARLLLAGVACLIAADLLLAFAHGLAAAFAGILMWGLHMALTQGVFAKLVADRAPAALRGSAFGAFNLATGFALLLASLGAGLIWDRFGSSATFLGGAGFAALSALFLVVRIQKPNVTPP
ncbi:putative major facilitator superfamily transporter [Sphingomonas changbaiensis NBRC 104936]|uniref:Putative major facilitator superfamily transporter n=1 Tax=Sphingomonas changbaiensis NBRC 104936 TaxID=1219043 RepID=A0A0E9MLB6_9SPHN|nr:MFS transporter [Sphingomonas changbaiensis]GAO38211.1 putative major facilitator superfamily transporter [Sphingomonas changbaiensis NBRC 104936]